MMFLVVWCVLKKRICVESALTAADGLDNFYFIALFERVTGMLTAWDNLLINLDSQALVLKLQHCDQLLEIETIIQGALFAVDCNIHGDWIVHDYGEMKERRKFMANY